MKALAVSHQKKKERKNVCQRAVRKESGERKVSRDDRRNKECRQDNPDLEDEKVFRFDNQAEIGKAMVVLLGSHHLVLNPIL